MSLSPILDVAMFGQNPVLDWATYTPGRGGWQPVPGTGDDPWTPIPDSGATTWAAVPDAGTTTWSNP